MKRHYLQNTNFPWNILPITLCAAGLTLAVIPGVAQTPATPKTTGTASRALIPGQPIYVPLSKEERWRRYLSSLVSPASVVQSAAGAGINQWSNTPSEWHQGAEGYGRRFANSYGIHIARESIRSGAGALLDEDTRYIASSDTRFAPRLKHAVLSTFMCRTHTGQERVAFSSIGALAGSAFLSRAWQPSSTSQPADAMSNFGVGVGVAAATNVVHEFLPRVFHFWGLRRD